MVVGVMSVMVGVTFQILVILLIKVLAVLARQAATGPLDFPLQ
jgi:hypothetical protein